MKEAIEILEGARELVAHGWCKGFSRTERGSRMFVCSSEALQRASTTLQLRYGDEGKARTLLIAQISGGSIQAWNDDPAVSKADVIDAFTRAIEGARASEVDA